MEGKLNQAYQEAQSCHGRSHDGNPGFSFHIPANEFSKSVTESAVWALGGVGLSQGEDEEGVAFTDTRPEMLLKTRPLTPSSNVTTPELRMWASSDPRMKEVGNSFYSRVLLH